MKILICPDKFKESLNAADVSAHIRNGILKVLPNAICSGYYSQMMRIGIFSGRRFAEIFLRHD